MRPESARGRGTTYDVQQRYRPPERDSYVHAYASCPHSGIRRTSFRLGQLAPTKSYNQSVEEEEGQTR
jgi:hypothetical protein